MTQKTTTRREWQQAIALLAVSTTVFLLGLARIGFWHGDPSLGYGLELQPLEINDDHRSVSIQPGNWYFMMVGKVSTDRAELDYVTSLLQSPQLQTGNLSAFALIDGNDADEQIRGRGDSESFPLLRLHDLPEPIVRKLALDDHDRRFVLIDPSLNVVFHARYLKIRDLRLLFEKHFSSASTGTSTLPLTAGDALSLADAAPLNVDEPLSLAAKTAIFFTSQCKSCTLENHLSQVATQQDTLRAGLELQGREPVLVFGPGFGKQETIARLQDLELRVPAYMAPALPGIEDPYTRESFIGSDVVVVETGSEARSIQDPIALTTYWSKFFRAPDTSLGQWMQPQTSSGYALTAAEGSARFSSLKPFPSPIAMMAEKQGRLYGVDESTHRIWAREQGRAAFSLGGIGNGPGELLYPTAVSAPRSGHWLFILDTGNDRIQVLTDTGRFLNEIPIDDAFDLAAVDSQVFTNLPGQKHVVQGFDGLSGESSTSFGAVVDPRQYFTDEVIADHIESYRASLNRAHLSADDQGKIWLAFRHLPILRRYAADGELELDVRLDLPKIQQLVDSLTDHERRPRWTSSINSDGIQMTVLIRDMAFDSASSTMLLLLADRTLARINAEGEVIERIDVRDLKNSPQGLAVDAGEILIHTTTADIAKVEQPTKASSPPSAIDS